MNSMDRPLLPDGDVLLTAEETPLSRDEAIGLVCHVFGWMEKRSGVLRIKWSLVGIRLSASGAATGMEDRLDLVRSITEQFPARRWVVVRELSDSDVLRLEPRSQLRFSWIDRSTDEFARTTRAASVSERAVVWIGLEDDVARQLWEDEESALREIADCRGVHSNQFRVERVLLRE